MSESLITKYRPKRFEDVIGQPVVKNIQNKCATRKLPNAFLFSGVRGTGKTTTARLVAMSINSKNPLPDGNPNLEDIEVINTSKGVNPNVYELDMASNRGIEEIRGLQKVLQYAPINNGYRVIILDEAHQITPQGASALLKSLEEPPNNTLFILCTTDPQKLLPTIRSRCEKYEFRRVTNEDITTRLATICKLEGYEYEQEALEIIASQASGSVRDAESLLAAKLVGEKIDVASVKTLLKVESDFDKLLSYIVKGNKVALLKYFRADVEKLVDENWLELFVNFLIDKSIKENSIALATLVSKVADYLKYLNANLSPTFVQLIFLKLAEGIEYLEPQKLSSDIDQIYAIADWFACEKFELRKGIALYYVDGLWLGLPLEPDHEEGFELAAMITSSEKLLEVPKGTDPNDLIELGILEIIE